MEPHTDPDLNDDDQFATPSVVNADAKPAQPATCQPASSEEPQRRRVVRGSSAFLGRETWYGRMIPNAGDQLASILGWSLNRGRSVYLGWAFLMLWMKGDFGRIVPTGRSFAIRLSPAGSVTLACASVQLCTPMRHARSALGA
jgi:hypothetical protein